MKESFINIYNGCEARDLSFKGVTVLIEERERLFNHRRSDRIAHQPSQFSFRLNDILKTPLNSSGVRKGSLAAPVADSSLTAAFEGKADIRPG